MSHTSFRNDPTTSREIVSHGNVETDTVQANTVISNTVFTGYLYGNIAFASGAAQASSPPNISADIRGNIQGQSMTANIANTDILYGNSFGNFANIRFIFGNNITLTTGISSPEIIFNNGNIFSQGNNAMSINILDTPVANINTQGIVLNTSLPTGYSFGNQTRGVVYADTNGAWSLGSNVGDIVIQNTNTNGRVLLSTNGAGAVPDISMKNGFVGIGNANPVVKFQVDGTTRVKGNLSVTANLIITGDTNVGNFYATRSNIGIVNANDVNSGNLYTTNVFSGNNTTKGLAFAQNDGDWSLGSNIGDVIVQNNNSGGKIMITSSGTGSAPDITVLRGGFVGIGNAAPVVRFQVDGTTRLKGNTTVTANLTVNGDTNVGNTFCSRLGVNTITDNQTRLVVNGNTKITSTSSGGVGNLFNIEANTSVTSFNMIMCSTGWASTPNPVFRVEASGNVFADGPYSSSGADFAEMFEWEDGNPMEEDRRGMTVVVYNGKIRQTTPSDDPEKIIGAVSSRATVIGGEFLQWPKKYITDKWGMRMYTIDPNDPNNMIPIINPLYTPVEYIPRSARPEWSPIGIVGRVLVREDQLVHPKWIPLKHIDDVIEYLIS